MRCSLVFLLSYAFFALNVPSADAASIINGGFEDYTTSEVESYSLGPSGQPWGRSDFDWSYVTAGTYSWKSTPAGRGWEGGAVARSNDFSTGWKHASSGNLFGIIKDRQTMYQTFTASVGGYGTLDWKDANRAAWRDLEWFGRHNNYDVNLTDISTGISTTLGSFTSEVQRDDNGDWWTETAKKKWVSRSLTGFYLYAGRSYILSFASMSPYNSNGDVDDRTTFLDDINLSTSPAPPPIPEPTTMAIFGLGGLGLAFLRRRR